MFVAVVYFSRGTLPQKRVRRALPGDLVEIGDPSRFKAEGRVIVAFL